MIIVNIWYAYSAGIFKLFISVSFALALVLSPCILFLPNLDAVCRCMNISTTAFSVSLLKAKVQVFGS